MKKLMIFAVAAIALVACSKEFDTNKSASNGTAIGFGTWAEQLTKARSITEGAFGNGDSFNVFGSKVLSGTASAVFNGDAVTYDGANWNYSPTRFWDPAATSYTFYAISPAGLVTGLNDTAKETAAKTGAFTTDEITFNGTVANDVMVAKKTPVTPTGTPAAYSNPVALDFQHVASLLDVKVKKSFALKDATVEVTNISLENIVYKGTLGVSAYDESTKKPTVAIANWTPATSESTTTFSGTGATLNQYGYESVTDEDLSGTANYFWQNFVVMPQTLVAATGTNPQQIKISYKITTGVGEVTTFTDKTVAFSAFDVVDNKVNTDTPAVAAAAGWNPNVHYVYTLTLDVNKIEFSATISAWDTTIVSGYHNLIN